MRGNELVVAGQKVKPGEEKEIMLCIAKLPSDTLIETPITVYRSEKPGPTVLFTGGLHGDEINGMEIVRRILTNGFHRCNAGTVICMPIVNIYGFLHYSRELPDGKDINRMFPGSKTGSLASRIAYQLMKNVVPVVDYGIDFHSGGASHTNFPQLRCVFTDKESLTLAKAFGPPFIVDSPFREKSFRKTANKKNRRVVVFEGGESNRLNVKAIAEGLKGTQRVLKFLGMTEEAPSVESKPIMLKSCSWMRASVAGIFHHHIKCGALVKEGQKLGTISDPFGRNEHEVTASQKGYIIGLNNSPVVTLGDALFNIGVVK